MKKHVSQRASKDKMFNVPHDIDINEKENDETRICPQNIYLWVRFPIVLLGTYPPSGQVVTYGQGKGGEMVSWRGTVTTFQQREVYMPIKCLLYCHYISWIYVLKICQTYSSIVGVFSCDRLG